ncbi:MAG TPA: VOC family protein [Ferruginibacter sp.]|nr:VOC family protein [Ferruginibacter sp.]HRO16846.1 VOC family protein [Ferruginibacter sp.]HRQ20218.1 VOC family protein [Ferruginibacter sp.]
MSSNNRNPFTWVEIYVNDMQRARAFYEQVLQLELVDMETPESVGEMHMVSFPWKEGAPNISGALVKMADMKPGSGGTLVYFGCEDAGVEISRVEAAGGKVLQPKMAIGQYGFCGICMDTEGNTIGFHSMT